MKKMRLYITTKNIEINFLNPFCYFNVGNSSQIGYNSIYFMFDAMGLGENELYFTFKIQLAFYEQTSSL